MKGEKEFFRKRFFGGFNRDDVIKYIAKIAEERNEAFAARDNAEKELRAITLEMEKLREENSALVNNASKPYSNVSTEESAVMEEQQVVQTVAPEITEVPDLRGSPVANDIKEDKMPVDIIDFSDMMGTKNVKETESAKDIAALDDDIAAIKEIGQIKTDIPAEDSTITETQETIPEPPEVSREPAQDEPQPEPTPEPAQDEPHPPVSFQYSPPTEPVWSAVPVKPATDEPPPPEPFLYATSPDSYWFADPNEPHKDELPPPESPPEPPQEEPTPPESPPEPPQEEPAPPETPPEPTQEEPTQEEPAPPEPPVEPVQEEPAPPEPPPVEEKKITTARVKVKIRKIQ